MLVTPPPPAKTLASSPLAAKRASNVMQRKSTKTPLESLLAEQGGKRAVQIVEFARKQWQSYKSGLGTWRENRRRYEQEAADVFKWRERGDLDEDDKPKIFKIENDSLNVIGGLAEFASAQAEQDLFGGEPWFAALPVGKSDPALAESMQKHLQWKHRDGRLVTKYSQATTRATCLGESFTLTTYDIDVDSYEKEINALAVNGKPVMVDGAYVTSNEQADLLTEAGRLKIPKNGVASWVTAYQSTTEVRSQGTETQVLKYTDLAFREDAPELHLRHTNFYHEVEMSALEAMRRFKLSKKDAVQLASLAEIRVTEKDQPDETDAKPDSQYHSTEEEQYGTEEDEQKLNARVRLVMGYLRIDPSGKGASSDIVIAFTPDDGDSRLWFANYLANVSPKGKLPVEVHVWEPVPDRLYGRGFFAKYSNVQMQVDNLWNQVAYKNRMHSNPVTGFNPDNLQSDEDEPDPKLYPGRTFKPKVGKTIEDVWSFLKMPDLDERSMELMQIGIQMAQLRSGITSASQGDMSSVPENNTATGIRQLMSRAAVLLKKPIRGLRRSFSRAFAYDVKLTYANFDRDEAFVWGEGEHTELITLKAEQVADLDIDVRMLLTQEQNQTKLESAQVAMTAMQSYLQALEPDKAGLRPLVLQIIKALEFDQADEIVRQPIVSIESMLPLLPPEEQNRLLLALQSAQQAQTLQPQVNANPQAPVTP